MTLENFNRLGKSYCNLNNFRYDPILKIDKNYYENLSNEEKTEIITPIVKKILKDIGRDGASFAWWKFELNRSVEEWVYWNYKNDKFDGLYMTLEEFNNGY